MLERVRNESLDDNAIQAMVEATVFGLYKERPQRNSNRGNIQNSDESLSLEEEAHYIDCVTNALKGLYIPGFFYITRIVLNPNKYLNSGFTKTTKAEVRKNIVNFFDKIIRENIQHENNLRNWNPEEIISYLQYMPDNSNPIPDQNFQLPELNMNDDDLKRLRNLFNLGDQGELNSLFGEFSFHYSKILNLLAQNDQIFRDLEQYGLLVEELMQPNIPYESIELLVTHMDKIPTVLELISLEKIKTIFRFPEHLSAIFNYSKTSNLLVLLNQNEQIFTKLARHGFLIEKLMQPNIPYESIELLVTHMDKIPKVLELVSLEKINTILRFPEHLSAIFNESLNNSKIQNLVTRNERIFTKLAEHGFSKEELMQPNIPYESIKVLTKNIDKIPAVLEIFPLENVKTMLRSSECLDAVCNVDRIRAIRSIKYNNGDEVVTSSLLLEIAKDLDRLIWFLGRAYQMIALARLFRNNDNNAIITIHDIELAKELQIFRDKDLEYIPSSDAYLGAITHIIETHLYYYNGNKEVFKAKLKKCMKLDNTYITPYDKTFHSNEKFVFLGVSVVIGVTITTASIVLTPISIAAGLTVGGVVSAGGTYYLMGQIKNVDILDQVEIGERRWFSPIALLRRCINATKDLLLDDYGSLREVSRFSEIRSIYKKNIIDKLCNSLSFLKVTHSIPYFKRIMEIAFNKVPNYVSNEELLFVKYYFDSKQDVINQDCDQELKFIDNTLGIKDKYSVRLIAGGVKRLKEELFSSIKSALENIRHIRSFLFAMLHGYSNIHHIPGVSLDHMSNNIYPPIPEEITDDDKIEAFKNSCRILYYKITLHNARYVRDFCQKNIKNSHLNAERKVDEIRREIYTITGELADYHRIEKLNKQGNEQFVYRN